MVVSSLGQIRKVGKLVCLVRLTASWEIKLGRMFFLLWKCLCNRRDFQSYTHADAIPQTSKGKKDF